MTQKNIRDTLALLRPVLASEAVQTAEQLYVEDFTTDELCALVGLLRAVLARVQSGDRQPAVVLQLAPAADRSCKR